MIKLFEMGDNNMVTLNKEWISLIPEFRRLLARDKGGPGDGSGKYKKQAQREFTYIFLMYDFRSPFENYPDREREQEALRASELTKGKIESDGDIWAAIRMYEKLMEKVSPTLSSWRKMKTTVQTLEDYLENVDMTERTDTGGKVHSIKEIQDGIKGMPSTHKSLIEMEEQVKKEMMDDSGLRGGATKGGDEDPDEDNLN